MLTSLKKTREQGVGGLRRNKRRGQALVESALIMLVFLATLIGIFDLGQLLFIHQSLVERVRWASRWGVVQQPFDSDSVKNMVVYAQPTVPTGATSGFLGLTPAKVEVIVTDAGTEFGRINVSIINYDYFFFNPMIHRSFQNTKAVSESLPFE